MGHAHLNRIIAVRDEVRKWENFPGVTSSDTTKQWLSILGLSDDHMIEVAHIIMTGDTDSVRKLISKVCKCASVSMDEDPSGCGATIVWWPEGLSGQYEIKYKSTGWSITHALLDALFSIVHLWEKTKLNELHVRDRVAFQIRRQFGDLKEELVNEIVNKTLDEHWKTAGRYGDYDGIRHVVGGIR